ncbi:MAG: protein-disulfide reductase DsbD family protein [Burkholderiaceae bacterium]
MMHPYFPFRLKALLAMALPAACLLLLLSLAGAPAWGQGSVSSSAKSVVTSERVRAELMAYAPQGVGPGKTVWVGLQLQHIPEWHTYWKNAGDSGLPTQLQWSLPPGVVAGEIAWPVPKKIPIGALANYGYEGTLLLPVPLTLTADYKPPLLGGDLAIKLNAAWLVCRLECIPEDGEFTLRVPTQGSYALHSAAFEAAFAAQPQPINGEAKVVLSATSIEVSVAGLPAAAHGKTLSFFPETAEVIETGAPYTQAWQGAVWTAQIPLAAQRSQSPKVMPVVLALKNENGDGYAGAWVSQAQVQGNWPAVGAPGGISPALAEALKTNNNAVSAQSLPPNAQGAASLSLLAALLGALVGGLILNLMPCVFPVLAIKVMGFAQHGGNRRAHRLSGLAYTAGVVLSFLALAVLLLVLRAAGEQLGWGFQLQSPWVVAALATLFTVIGLNLMGLFEFGQFLPSRVATLQAKNPALDAGLSGVLAVAVASPCTAPFMGASLGLAVALPWWQALLVFAFLGLGMALPYLAASLIPAVARALPRPGAWMDTFRKFMAFPMFATTAWLVWVLGQQTGIDGAGALLALLVALAMVLWGASLAGRSRTVVASISIASLALLTWAIGPNVIKFSDFSAPAAASAPDGWQAWEPGRVDQLLASGQPVFVDFTAAWCVTCQYNKKTTLVNADVMRDFAAKKVVLLRADWTRRDPAITAALGQLGRSGVPVYVFYKSGQPPQVLSEILSVPEVRSAIAKL